MRKVDRVSREIAIADAAYARHQFIQVFKNLKESVRRCGEAIEAISVEAALFAKDDPFCEDGSPCESAMLDHAACDEAVEMLADVRLKRTR